MGGDELAKPDRLARSVPDGVDGTEVAHRLASWLLEKARLEVLCYI